MKFIYGVLGLGAIALSSGLGLAFATTPSTKTEPVQTEVIASSPRSVAYMCTITAQIPSPEQLKVGIYKADELAFFFDSDTHMLTVYHKDRFIINAVAKVTDSTITASNGNHKAVYNRQKGTFVLSVVNTHYAVFYQKMCKEQK